MSIDVSFRAHKPVGVYENSEPEKTESKMSTTAKVITGVALTGLTALGAYGMYVLTKGKAKPKIENPIKPNEELLKLQEEIKTLKGKIKDAYLSKREDVLAEIGQNSFTTGSLRSVASREEAIKGCERDLANHSPIVEEFSTKVRAKLTELKSDPDFQLCRKMRKDIIKRNSSGDYSETAKQYLIDGVIEAKINGKSKLFDFAKINLNEAMELLRNPKADNNMVMDLITRHKTRLELQNQLSLSQYPLRLDIFEGFSSANASYAQVKSAKNGIRRVQEAWAKRPEVMKSLAQEFRQSEDVLKLKELNGRIKELQDSV